LRIASHPQTDPVDIPFYVTDNTAVTTATGWRPQFSIPDILDDIFAWLRKHHRDVETILM
jgi:CDP-paratose 2-epimerase